VASGRESNSNPPLIERAAPRALFAELVAGALGETRLEPSPMAVAYLIELLDSRISVTPPPEAAADEATLAESLYAARARRGAERALRLRRLGDRALFVAGWFGDSLSRRVVDIDYYGDVGRTAYAQLSDTLAQQLSEDSWPGLYAELAERFGDFVDVLAEVGDRTRSERCEDLLRLYERYVRTGSARDRRRLLRAGQLPPDRASLRSWQ
jgi:hypothetical protein